MNEIKKDMIELERITKRFADGQRMLTVLDSLTLEISDGEFVAITGESGAGKTTLLNILGTMLQPNEGTYRLGGVDVYGDCTAEKLCQLRNKEIGFVHQDHRLLPQFTAWQNILLPTLTNKSTATDDEQRRALVLMDIMGITLLKDSPVTQLSGGEQTRVAIARALINQPSLLLADEPTGLLDTDNAQAIANLFRKVNSELKTTIVMATHSAEMAKVAHRRLRLVSGKLLNIIFY
jgi:ABC-type lipoprotein export system ATPase subunit